MIPGIVHATGFRESRQIPSRESQYRHVHSAFALHSHLALHAVVCAAIRKSAGCPAIRLLNAADHTPTPAHAIQRYHFFQQSRVNARRPDLCGYQPTPQDRCMRRSNHTQIPGGWVRYPWLPGYLTDGFLAWVREYRLVSP